MSEIFFKDLVRLIVYFFILSMMAIGIIQFNLLYIFTRDILFWYAYMGNIWFFIVFGSKCYSDYKRFRERSFLFFPKCEDPAPQFESADLEKLWKWAQGATWKELYNSPYECNMAVRRYLKENLKSRSNESM